MIFATWLRFIFVHWLSGISSLNCHGWELISNARQHHCSIFSNLCSISGQDKQLLYNLSVDMLINILLSRFKHDVLLIIMWQRLLKVHWLFIFIFNILQMVRVSEAWRAAICGVTKSRTWLSDWTRTLLILSDRDY